MEIVGDLPKERRIMQGITPQFSRKRVQRSGDRIREGTSTEEDMEVLENWRAAHAHIINTFQANLRSRTRGTKFLVGQRLKRRVTIIDKLTRQPGMNLARMHDIAGCRVVFPTAPDMLKFRNEFIQSRAKHERVTAERDQFNYFESPKESGYRGIHDVYKYNSYAPSASAWNGLSIEIQYRTRPQHAWATAVEIADLLNKSRIKFSESANNHQDFFRVCSEIIARTTENSNSCLPELSDADLVAAFQEAEKVTHMLDILSKTNRMSSNVHDKFFKKRLNTILIFPFEGQNTVLRVQGYKDTRRALDAYEVLEKENEGKADIVLVRAEDANAMMKVFQNYFTDARDFVKYVNSGLKSLK